MYPADRSAEVHGDEYTSLRVLLVSTAKSRTYRKEEVEGGRTGGEGEREVEVVGSRDSIPEAYHRKSKH
jgi:hypothetical protein